MHSHGVTTLWASNAKDIDFKKESFVILREQTKQAPTKIITHFNAIWNSKIIKRFQILIYTLIVFLKQPINI